MAKVSICIPTYNRRDYLAQTLQSVFAQTYTDYEVIIVDDGSDDGTAAMVNAWKQPVRYYWQENRGDARARNRLIELAAGQFITFIDSDDLLLPDSVARLLDAIEKHPQLCCSYGPYIRIDSAGNQLATKLHPLPSGRITAPLFQRILVHSCGSMFPKSALQEIGGFDPTLPVCSDYSAWLELSQHYDFMAVAQPTFLRRRHGGNLSGLSFANVRTELQVLQQFYQRYGHKIIQRRPAMRRLARESYRVGRCAWRENNYTAAEQYFRQSLHYYPAVKPLLRLLAFKLASFIKE